VAISSKAKRFTLNAAQVRAVIGRSGSSTSPNELKSAKASGGVKVVQSAQRETSTLQSNSATYTVQGSGAVVQATGSVRLTNSSAAKRETLLATGSSGTAVLSPNSPRGIDRATLNGPVRVQVVQSGAGGSKVVFSGNKMTLNGNLVSLTGKVKATGSGASRFGDLSNVDSVTVTLNDKGEMTKFSFKSGSGV
jgi:hypothetical protein